MKTALGFIFVTLLIGLAWPTDKYRVLKSEEMNLRDYFSWCGRGDLNPHAFRRHPLKMVCLPVPPLPPDVTILLPIGYADACLCPNSCVPVFVPVTCILPIRYAGCRLTSASRTNSFCTASACRCTYRIV